MPSTLSERFVQCTDGNKPLVLHRLISTGDHKTMLIFSASLEHTHRLCLVLQHMGVEGVAEISSQSEERRKVLQQVRRRLVHGPFSWRSFGPAPCACLSAQM